MKQYKYNSAIINIKGEVKREKIEEVAKIFFMKVDKCKKQNKKGKL